MYITYTPCFGVKFAVEKVHYFLSYFSYPPWHCVTGEKDAKSSDQRSQRREDQLAHLNMDLAPASPAASSSDTPAPVQRDGSITSVSSLTALPPDTQKFLKFAGKMNLT